VVRGIRSRRRGPLHRAEAKGLAVVQSMMLWSWTLRSSGRRAGKAVIISKNTVSLLQVPDGPLRNWRFNVAEETNLQGLSSKHY
jgi:hypothetical protein